MKNHLVNDSNCKMQIYISPQKLQGMTNIVGLTISVGDIIPRFTISFEQDIVLVTLNIKFMHHLET